MANWQDDELLLRPQLNCRTVFGTLHRRNLDFIQLAEVIGCKASVLAFKPTKTHLVQTVFRRALLTNYNHRCAISGLAIPELLVASHITPWAADEKLRANPTNGIALNALYDKAFDRHLISFDDEFRLVLSDRIKRQENNQMIQEYFFGFEGKVLEMLERFLPDREALKQIERLCTTFYINTKQKFNIKNHGESSVINKV